MIICKAVNTMAPTCASSLLMDPLTVVLYWHCMLYHLLILYVWLRLTIWIKRTRWWWWCDKAKHNQLSVHAKLFYRIISHCTCISNVWWFARLWFLGCVGCSESFKLLLSDDVCRRWSAPRRLSGYSVIVVYLATQCLMCRLSAADSVWICTYKGRHNNLCKWKNIPIDSGNRESII